MELSATAARELVKQILAALQNGEKEHGLGMYEADDAPAYLT